MDDVIRDILNSPSEYINHDDFVRLAWAVKETTFISTDLKDENEYLSDVYGNLAIPVFTTHEKFNIFCDLQPQEWSFMKLVLLFNNENAKDIIINPGSDNFCLTKDMVRRILFNEM